MFESVFSTLEDNDNYTHSGMLDQSDKHKLFVDTMLTETALHEKCNHWTTIPKRSHRFGLSSESIYLMAQLANTKLGSMLIVAYKMGS